MAFAQCAQDHRSKEGALVIVMRLTPSVHSLREGAARESACNTTNDPGPACQRGEVWARVVCFALSLDSRFYRQGSTDRDGKAFAGIGTILS